MTRPTMKRFAVVRGGRVIAVAMRDADDTSQLPPGISLMLESDAIALGLPRDDVAPDVEVSLGQQALQLNLTAATRAARIATDAATMAAGTDSPSSQQLVAMVRQLAGWIAVLARDDLVANRQRAALILPVLDDFDPIGVAPQAVTITPTPAEASASGVPLAS